MKRKNIYGLLLLTAALFFIGKWVFVHYNFNAKYAVGQKVDSLNGVFVYYNGGVAHLSGRNLAPDGYNLGMKYQCVEFVKRYYYEHLQHKMPDSYGHAKEFFDPKLADGEKNDKRGLVQYTNPGNTKPCPDDLLIYNRSMFNAYGHVAIVSKVSDTAIEIVQQNPGPFGSSRKTIPLSYEHGKWKLAHKRIAGWLRKGSGNPDSIQNNR